MDIQKLTTFFKWCSLINIGLFILSALMIMVASDFVYSTHGQLFNMPRDAFDVVLYELFGIYKILILIFNLVPYAALRIIGKG